MNERDARWWLDRYGVHIALLAVFALVLVLAPSKGASQNTSFDRAGSGSSAPGPSGAGSATTLAPGADSAGGGAVGGGGGGAGGGGAGPADSGGAGPAGAAGLGEDCSRAALLGARFGCMPLADGTNAGATYAGVAADRVTIVAYNEKLDPQVDAVLGDRGYNNDPALVANQVRAFAEWLQAHFQTWGRAVDLKFLQSSATDAAGSRAEAVKATQEMGAFMVVTYVYNTDFIDEVTRRGVICICPGAFSDRGPLLWDWGLDDLVYDSHFAEFVCKRLGPAADYAGPGTAGKPRVYGYVHPQADQPWIADFRAKLAQCGIVPARELAYSEDITTAVQQATNLIQQAKSAGVTTLLWPGSPYIAMYFLYAAASNQQYYPEWVSGADGYFESRFLDQDQMSRTFGVSRLMPAPSWEETVSQQIYAQLRPGETFPRPGFGFRQLLLAFLALERAGPALDPATVEQGLFTVRIPMSNVHEESVSFGPGDYGGMDDMAEIWWDPHMSGPDGKPGDFQFVNGGRRYSVGSWPQTPAQPFKPECTAAGSCGEAG